MTHSEIKPPHVLFLFSDTGGGHRSAAEAISDAHLDATLVVVTGRSHKLMAQLEAENWSLPAFIYGFTHDMPNFMCSADILLTKAGPGTISEAFISGLPMILYSRMPGQEDGNVSYVVNQGAGVWALEPNRIIEVLHNWLDHPTEREKVAVNCRRLARLDASHLVARHRESTGCDRKNNMKDIGI